MNYFEPSFWKCFLLVSRFYIVFHRPSFTTRQRTHRIFTLLLKISVELIKHEKFSIKDENAIFNLFFTEQVPPKWMILNSIGTIMPFNFVDLSNMLNYG